MSLKNSLTGLLKLRENLDPPLPESEQIMEGSSKTAA
jgi:hypothetical protein